MLVSTTAFTLPLVSQAIHVGQRIDFPFLPDAECRVRFWCRSVGEVFGDCATHSFGPRHVFAVCVLIERRYIGWAVRGLEGMT